ncbi:ATPase family AAA domain-containing protein 2 [Cricetulus griseus]|nr:ATPase family AAA domain-containing protein 2 [Cricetulus griseus]
MADKEWGHISRVLYAVSGVPNSVQPYPLGILVNRSHEHNTDHGYRQHHGPRENALTQEVSDRHMFQLQGFTQIALCDPTRSKREPPVLTPDLKPTLCHVCTCDHAQMCVDSTTVYCLPLDRYGNGLKYRKALTEFSQAHKHIFQC